MAATSKEVSTKDADVDRETNDASPPADDVTSEVNLLVILVLGPEADSTDKERPIERTTGVGMRSGQTGVMLPHQELKLAELPEEVHFLGFLDGSIAAAVSGLLVDYRIVSTNANSEERDSH